MKRKGMLFLLKNLLFEFDFIFCVRKNVKSAISYESGFLFQSALNK